MTLLKPDTEINNRYIIRDLIGKGALGAVYLVSDMYKSCQPAALKTILNKALRKKGSLARFKHEYEVMTRLKHPNLIEVYNFGYDEVREIYYLTMEYFNGRTLQNIIRNKTLKDLHSLINIFIELLRGIEFIHSRNIICRDIKPSNIMVNGNKVKIMDFGLSDIKKLDMENIKGSVIYQAPETFRGQGDYKIDIFALGIIFTELLTGRPLYHDSSVSFILPMIIDEESFRENQRHVIETLIPDNLKPVAYKMTAYCSKDRYSSCMDIIQDINRSLGLSYPLETEPTMEAYVSGISFTGRKGDIKKLKTHLLSHNPVPRLLLISGNPGIGKTMMLAELKKFCQLNDILFLDSYCPGGESRTLNAVELIIQQIKHYSSKSIDFSKAQTGPGFVKADFGGSGLDTKSLYLQNIVNYIINFLSSSKRKTVFYFDDVSGIDSFSLTTVLSLLRIIKDRPALRKRLILFASIKEEELDNFLNNTGTADTKEIFAVHRMKPFKPGQVRQYFQNVFGAGRYDSSIRDNISFITKKTGGNPYFLSEFIKYTLKEGIIVRTGRLWSISGEIGKLDIPSSIKEILDSRIELFTDNPVSKKLLLILALLRIPADLNILSCFFKPGEKSVLISFLGIFEKTGLIMHSRLNQISYAVSNGLVRERILHKIQTGKEIHLIIARKLESVFSDNRDILADELSHHYRLAGDKEKEIHYIQKYCSGIILRHYDFNDLMSRYRRALTLSENLHGKIHKITASIHESIADLYYRNHDLQKALKAYQTALEIIENLECTPSADYALILSRLGSVYYRNQNMDKALESYKSCLSLHREITDKDDEKTADLFIKISEVYISRNSFEIAVSYLDRAYYILKGLYGEESDKIADLLEAYAFFYFQKGDNRKSAQYLHMVIDLKKSRENCSSIYLALHYMRLGIIYTRLGSFGQALTYLKKSLSMQRTYYKSKHPDLASVYGAMGVLYLKLCNYRNAMAYVKKALVLCRIFFGENSPFTADMMINLCNIYSDMGRYIPALKLAINALGIYTEAYGPESPQSAMACNNIGIQYNKCSSPKKAVPYLQKAVKINSRTYKKSNPILGINYINIGVSYHQLKEYKKAVYYYERALDILTNTLGKEHPNISHIYYNIGLCFQFREDLKKALFYYEKALAISVPSLGTDNPYSRSQYQSITELLKEIGDHKKKSMYDSLFGAS